MTKIFFSLAFVLVATAIKAQKYPDPEFSNEIYYLQKDSAMVKRLEKGISKLDTKMKMAGYGGAETSYEMDGQRATTRLNSGSNLSFVYYSGASATSNPKTDSMMRANGVDPQMMRGGYSDISNLITLYKADPAKDKRKIYVMKQGGMFGSHKNQSSDKYTFSVRKIREGYWELVVDKSLPKGEYIFTMVNMSMGNMDGAMSLFAFAVD